MMSQLLQRHRKGLGAILIILLTAAIAFSQSLSFAVVGDTGDPGENLDAIAQQMSSYHKTKSPLEFVLLLGDNIYDDGVGDGLTKHFERPFKGLLDAGVKFYAVLGNHDIKRPEGIQAQTNYANFNMGGNHFYSFKKADGLVEFFALDSTALSEEAEKLVDANLTRLTAIRETTMKALTALRPAATTRRAKAATARQEKKLEVVDSKISESEQFLSKIRAVKASQMSWLDTALANSTAQWKIVFLHHSIFSSAYKNGGHGREQKVLRLRKVLHEKFVHHKVNVVFGGHDHVFEKTKVQVSPVTNHKITYMTSGAGSKLRKGDLDKKNGFHQFGEDRKYSFLVVRLSATQMEIDVIDKDGKDVFPRFAITKP